MMRGNGISSTSWEALVFSLIQTSDLQVEGLAEGCYESDAKQLSRFCNDAHRSAATCTSCFVDLEPSDSRRYAKLMEFFFGYVSI